MSPVGWLRNSASNVLLFSGHLISRSCVESSIPSGLTPNQGWSGHSTRPLHSTVCPWASVSSMAVFSFSWPYLVAVLPVKVGHKCSLRSFCGFVVLCLGTLFAVLSVIRSFLAKVVMHSVFGSLHSTSPPELGLAEQWIHKKWDTSCKSALCWALYGVSVDHSGSEKTHLQLIYNTVEEGHWSAADTVGPSQKNWCKFFVILEQFGSTLWWCRTCGIWCWCRWAFMNVVCLMAFKMDVLHPFQLSILCLRSTFSVHQCMMSLYFPVSQHSQPDLKLN